MKRLLVGLAGCVLMAGPPVATVSSSADFRLRGAEVRVSGVPQWPVLAGDEIVAGRAPVMVTFQGGSQVYLNAGARARLSVEGKQTVLRLMSGDLAYKVARSSPVGVAALSNGVLPARSDEGMLSVWRERAVWAPVSAEPEGLFQNYRVTPFNMEFVQRWRGNEAPFGRPPGTPPGQEEPPNPPGPPPGRPPVSISR